MLDICYVVHDVDCYYYYMYIFSLILSTIYLYHHAIITMYFFVECLCNLKCPQLAGGVSAIIIDNKVRGIV